MEENTEISQTRVKKERELLESLTLENCTFSFPQQSRSLEIKTFVEDSPVNFYIHLPERYPFQQPIVTVSVDRVLTSISTFENEDNILEHVIGESWIPSYHLTFIIEKLVQFASQTYKLKGKGLLIGLLSDKKLGLVVLISLLLRVLVGTQWYSGFDNAPRYGDYEAQRH